MTESMIPMTILPMTFLFVLLIILIAKAPKTGAWIVGGLIFLFPLLLYRLAMTGALAHEEAIPVVVVPVTFLFVLMVILLAKAPKAGVGLIIALVVMGLVGLFLWPLSYHRRVAIENHELSDGKFPVTQDATVWVEQSAADGSSTVATVQEFDRVFKTSEPAPAPELLPPVPIRQEPITPPAVSPIWSEGVEQEFDADVYPSQLAAIRAMGSRMDKAIRGLVKDANSPQQITLFQEGRDPALLTALKGAIQQVWPQTPCGIEAEMRNIRPNEIGIEVHFHEQDMQPAPWAQSPDVKTASGRIEVRTFITDGQVAADRGFVEKPWVQDFATFASTRPQQHFIVARSNGTCTSEGEANQQALDDARARLTESLGKRVQAGAGRLPQPAITTTDVLDGGFVIDRFAQSFEGSAGRIWRQALLIDVSGPKLAQLAGQKTHEFRKMRESWARMGFSVIGVIVLIGVIYFFLNMATMGYYEWSLRIAGVVLAIVAIISVLMVVQ
jgi:hypothetical protein